MRQNEQDENKEKRQRSRKEHLKGDIP
ncbi:Protein CBG27737 [Caenorhabditis briggsae]|uniref:Protein CBG27737 n=1 Tax=Caenorhabditis briggsae TaxID=6238 RepID=B6IJ35_CAEBR|nr:Protein CBG27737 [Caenorhabditis briggsae]CAS00015.1 Protein CBG27737 [Caenorhabditis briggsae]